MGERISKINNYCYKIRVEGIVQGVGFRPFIYRLAKDYNLTGYVLNDSEGVLIEVQGNKTYLENFIRDIEKKAPPASFVANIKYEELPLKIFKEFVIKPSPKAIERQTMISPDLAICKDCRLEIAKISDRRYKYPFTNCTNCGPRFSIVEDIPYDRKYTTMKNFIMCEKCQSEYDNPLDRRFHAQPNACNDCGPQYRLFGKTEILENDIIKKAHDLIKQGAIIAVKGIGGYHLACDAYNKEAVEKLRRRKIREDKPFAVMVNNLDTVKRLCKINELEEKLLTSTVAPIVLLKKSVSYDLAVQVAPNNNYLGVMMAYAPIHCLLLDKDDVFVMTSANLSDEPIVYRDEEVDYLNGIADYKLVHNRKINTRIDDSVVRVFNNEQMIIRRSRGFAPAPINLGNLASDEVSILACGSELKNTFCLTKHDKAFLSQHIGDLENLAVNNAYKESLILYKRLFDIKPKLIACDMHPDYFSSKYAKLQNLPLIKVQHHHAHIASVLLEHNLTKKVIGIALDGTGFGEDGCIWGGEFMIADLASYKRVGHFSYIPLPSGAKAIKEPWRLALWLSYKAHQHTFKEKYPKLLQKNWQLLLKCTENKFNAPLTSSAGRVFDAVSSLLGICHNITYEGQPAIELEKIAYSEKNTGQILPYSIYKENMQYILDFMPLFKVIYDLKQTKTVSYIAKSFHLTMEKAISEMIENISNDTGIKDIALSGGVCQNITLLTLLYEQLKDRYNIYLNKKVPPNDGGISFGQAGVALYRYKKGLIDL